MFLLLLLAVEFSFLLALNSTSIFASSVGRTRGGKVDLIFISLPNFSPTFCVSSAVIWFLPLISVFICHQTAVSHLWILSTTAEALSPKPEVLFSSHQCSLNSSICVLSTAAVPEVKKVTSISLLALQLCTEGTVTKYCRIKCLLLTPVWLN